MASAAEAKWPAGSIASPRTPVPAMTVAGVIGASVPSAPMVYCDTVPSVALAT